MDREPPTYDEPMYVYVLVLDKDRYYIGKTKDIEARYSSHAEGRGAAWTGIYKPISIAEHFISEAKFAEENKTKEYMLRYGIYKVRGGPYASPVLEDEMVRTIQRQLWHALDKCFMCGGGHFISECKFTEHPKECCICGGQHWASECTEMNDVDGVELPTSLVRR
jgi:predicted GIY-YIG superfamily endonuclease